MLGTNLVWGAVAVPGNEPGGVVVGDKLLQPAPQLLDGVEGVHPEEVLLQGADEAFRDTIALGLANEGGRALDAKEGDLVLEVAGQVVGAVVVAQGETLGHVPLDAAEVARALGASLAEVEGAFQGLAQKRLLVLEPGDPARIRMAPPFAGVETPFRVLVQDKIYYANCAWDSLGIPAALHMDALIEASDAYTGEPITLEVRDARPVHQPCVIHFAVPAARWWEDILYT